MNFPTDKNQCIIQTDRLRLRLLEMGDAERLFEILNGNPEIMKLLTFTPPKDVKETESFRAFSEQEYVNKTALRWGIEYEGVLMGVIGLENLKEMQGPWLLDSGMIGYWLSPEVHGKGLMTEAVKAVIAFGFDTVQLHKIWIRHFVGNVASQRVIEKCGFVHWGTEKDSGFRYGKWWDAAYYQLTVDAYNKA